MVGMSVSPDFNSVGIKNSKSATARIGVYVYYNVMPGWYLSTGLLYSNKKYNASGEYYFPGNNYWKRKTNGILPDNVTGSCRVIDIPLLVSYRVLQKERISLMLTSGISSYLLQDEIYDFEFEQENPDAVDSWKTTDNSMTPFSIGNISLGIEAPVSKRLFLVLEPYIKLPLKDIGWGHIRLYSSGVQLNIKYRLWK